MDFYNTFKQLEDYCNENKIKCNVNESHSFYFIWFRKRNLDEYVDVLLKKMKQLFPNYEEHVVGKYVCFLCVPKTLATLH